MTWSLVFATGSTSTLGVSLLKAQEALGVCVLSSQVVGWVSDGQQASSQRGAP